MVPMPSCTYTSSSSEPSTAKDDVAALHAGLAGLDAVLQVESGVRGFCAAGRLASSCSAAASGSSVSIRLSSLSRLQRLDAHAGNLGEEDQLVGLQGDRDAGRDLLHGQVEGLAGRREAEGDSSTIAPKSSVRLMPATSTLRTRARC